jgi:hypothetical protein
MESSLLARYKNGSSGFLCTCRHCSVAGFLNYPTSPGYQIGSRYSVRRKGQLRNVDGLKTTINEETASS